MNKYALLLLIGTLTSIHMNVSAQIMWEPETGVIVRGFYEPMPITILPGHSPGEGLVVWSDPRSGDWDLYGQLMDATGNPLWEDGGRPLISSPQQQPDAKGVAFDDGWFMAWLEEDVEGYPYNFSPLFMQRFTSQGTPMWFNPDYPSERGIPVLDDLRPVSSYTVYTAENGSLFIATAEYAGEDTSEELHLYNIFGDGSPNPDWPVDGIVLGTEPRTGVGWSGTIHIHPDAEDGILVSWEGKRFFTKRVSLSGDVMWERISVVNTREDVFVCSDGWGGLFVAWAEVWSNEFGWKRQVRANRVYSNGDLAAHPKGIPLTGRRRNVAAVHGLVPSEPGSAIVVYRRNNRARALKMGGALELEVLWPEPAVFHNQSVDDIPIVMSDNANGVVLLAGDYQEYYVHHVTNEGVIDHGEAVVDDEWYGPWAASVPPYVAILGQVRNEPNMQVRYHLGDPATNTVITPDVGSVVAQGWGARVGDTERATHGVGSEHVFYVWEDERFGGMKVQPYVQRLDITSGAPLVPEAGIPALPAFAHDSVAFDGRYTTLDVDEQESVFVAFSASMREEEGDRLCLQKLAPDLTPAWSDSGVYIRVSNNDEHRTNILHPNLEPNGQGGVFAAFTFKNYTTGDEGAAVAQFDDQGTPIWVQHGNPYLLLPGESEAWYLRWFERNVSRNELMLVVHKDNGMNALAVDENGNVLWTTTFTPFVEDNLCVTLFDDQVLVVWEDSLSNVCGQLIDETGVALWGDPPPILVPDQGLYILDIDIADAHDGEFWLGLALEYDYTGVVRFDDLGVPVFDDPIALEGGTGVSLAAELDGSVYVLSILDEPSSGHAGRNAIEIAHLGRNGDFNHDVVRLEPWSYIEYRSIESDGRGGIIPLWSDSRLSSGRGGSLLVTQRIYLPAAGVAEGNNNTPPRIFALEPIYPNPFNGTATISLTVPSPGEVNVALFNVLGQEVMTVARGSHIAGTHQITVDASALASGIYFVRAEMANSDLSATQKIVLMK
jgi:hypothetical protein